MKLFLNIFTEASACEQGKLSNRANLILTFMRGVEQELTDSSQRKYISYLICYFCCIVYVQ